LKLSTNFVQLLISLIHIGLSLRCVLVLSIFVLGEPIIYYALEYSKHMIIKIQFLFCNNFTEMQLFLFHSLSNTFTLVMPSLWLFFTIIW